jgi:chromosome segregation ATPase
LRTPFKIVEPTLDGPREELRLSIIEVEAAEAASAKSRASVSSAEDHLRAMQMAHARATSALEHARAGRRPLADRLEEAASDDERWAISDEYNAADGRPAITAEDLRKMRQEVESADDEVVAARSALDLAHDRARPTTSALNRARNRRQRAVWEVTRPEVGRLMRECQDLVEELSAKRAALNYVANSLVDPFEGDRRAAFHYFGRQLFPEEAGLRSEFDLTRRNAALAAWTQFAENITKDATAPFPG